MVSVAPWRLEDLISQAMDINIVVPPLARTRFTGGIWCVMQHAQQLGERGHRVRVVPTHPCGEPDWVPRPWAFSLVNDTQRHAATRGLRAVGETVTAALRFKLSRRMQPSTAEEACIRAGIGYFGLALANFGLHGQRMGAAVDHLARVLPDADTTVATDTETVWPVALAGRGALAYFAQHYEPYFWKERLGGAASRRESELSYRLGLFQLANSPWLQQKLQAETGRRVWLCPNAIDHAIFHGDVVPRQPSEPLRIISYGGRGAEWKGFRELCEAMRIVSAQVPAGMVQWSVYGGALLPPDNPVCKYQALGFLKPEALASAYRANHVLLSASWYESFPLFPIEAMACGLAAITSQPGTEAFAEHMRTAWVIPPRDPRALADAILTLAANEPLRQAIAQAGRERATQFTWAGAGATMDAALREVVAASADTKSASSID